ncbi:MAG: peptidoglycan-binding domain-containing protein [Hyphomicrobiaceae bacterium]
MPNPPARATGRSASGGGVGARQAQPNRQLVLAIQRELAQRGYFPNRPNGRLGVTTRAAIMAYEVDHQLPISAHASESVLQAIILGSTATGADHREQLSAEARELIRLVQHLLKRGGEAEVRKTGTLDTQTRRAIERFQKRNALVPNGRITAVLIQRLNEAVRRG